MLYADALRPPRFGATLAKAIDRGAAKLPDVVRVLIDEAHNLAGIVARTPFVLDEALTLLQATWDTPEHGTLETHPDVDRARAADRFEHTLVDEGAGTADKVSGERRLSARYRTAYMAHAAMEPRAATVSVTPARVDVWCGSQDPYFVRGRIADLLGRDEDDVVVHPLRMGGGFGGRILCQPAEEAALFSAKVGRPVRVQWSRETEFQQNYLQPAFSHAIDAGLDKDGNIVRWQHDFVSAPIIFGLVPKSVAPLLDLFLADKGTARGAAMPYRVRAQLIRYSDIRTEIPTGAWRGLGAAPNCFAIESMIDELAHLAGKDALAFRLRHLDRRQARLRAVLQRVGEISPWGRPMASDSGLGLASAIYKGQTRVAVVAKVQVDHGGRQLQVVKIWCVQDSGLVINPDQVENQILGNLVWGCGMALKERLTFTEGVVDQHNFDSYEPLRHNEAPAVQIALIEPAKAPPVADGEAAFAPVAAAIANAAFAATGRRPRQLPFDYETLFS